MQWRPKRRGWHNSGLNRSLASAPPVRSCTTGRSVKEWPRQLNQPRIAQRHPIRRRRQIQLARARPCPKQQRIALHTVMRQRLPALYRREAAMLMA